MKSKMFVPFLALFVTLSWGCEKDPVNWVSDTDTTIEFRNLGDDQNADCFNFKTEVVDASLGYFEIPGDFDIPVSKGWGAAPFYATLGELSGTMASIVTNTTPNPQNPDVGAVHYELMHFFLADDGVSYFYTSDKAVCAPIGGTANPCHVNDKMTIVGGGGDFEGVTGKINTHGEILITGLDDYGIPVGSLNLRLSGRICIP